MRHGYFVAIGVLAVVIAVGSLALAPVAGQARAPATSAAAEAAAKTEPTLKTSWGEPDLQGVWSNDYQIPLQRSAQNAGKEFYTDAERAELDRQRASARGQNKRSPRGTERDVSGAYDATVYLSLKHAGRRTSLIVDPLDGRIPPLTPEAMKRRDAIREFQLALLQATDSCKNKLPDCAGGQYGPPSPRRAETPPYYLTGLVNRADGPEDRGLSERCMVAILPDFGIIHLVGFFLQIAQSPGAVSLFYDVGQGQGWHRIIPVDGSPHLPPSVRQWWGDSRGRWEGNTLVVDVTNFTGKTDFQGSRENLHLVERWTRTGPSAVEYVVTMDDPTTWTKPWTVKQEYARQSDQAIRVLKEPRCHEGNLGMIGLLAGERAEEKAFAEGRGPDPATTCTACAGFLESETREQ